MAKKKEPSLEELFLEIEGILKKMDEKDVSLEDSFLLYEDGIKKIKACSGKIEAVEKKMLLLNGQGGLEELQEE